MSVKDITDRQVCEAVERIARDRLHPGHLTLAALLSEMTGQPEKVCWRAMERTCRRDLIDYGSSLNVAFLTDKGKRLLAEQGGE